MLALLVVAVLAAVAAACDEQSCAIVISGNLAEKPATRGPELDRADISIGNYLLFTIRTPAAGFTVAERERILYMRLTEIMSNERMDTDRFHITDVRGKPTICVGDHRLVTVYPRDAEAAGCSSEQLARQWLESLQTNLRQVSPVFAAAAPVTYDVAVGGTLLFRLRDTNGYGTLRERGAAVEAQVVNAVSKDGMPAISVRPIGDKHAVYADDERIVTVTCEDARLARLKSSEALAQSWAGNLTNALPVIKAGLPD